ncbi:hypothetical protein [Novosphingobium sp. MD-1]|uniref:hypothetical protein n=1 Tax=Novosphingobium sp. MD-1 TaxID=1630648 RepID=UPI000F7E8CF9|nr:hypothetical protein [Novosphingobium sp. MD-1]
MSAFRCQICGRRKHLRKDGTVVHHCVGGPRCPGSGHPPIEHDDARLISYAAEIERAYRKAYAAVRVLEERRANFIDPALIIRRGLFAGQALRIGRRLQRHRDWPERYRRSIARQMDRHGYAWAEPPPDYLVERIEQNGRGHM